MFFEVLNVLFHHEQKDVTERVPEPPVIRGESLKARFEAVSAISGSGGIWTYVPTPYGVMRVDQGMQYTSLKETGLICPK